MIKQLRWLVWKHMKERTRQFNHTFWEFFCGIVIIFLVVVSITLLENTRESVRNDNMVHVHGMEIIYTPSDDVIDNFIQSVENRLKVNPARDHSEIKVTKVRGFRDEDEMYKHLDTINLNKSFFVVSFKSKPSEFYKLPLTYTIGLNGLKDRSREVQNQYHGTEKSETNNDDVDKLDIEDSIALTRFVWAMNNVYMEAVSGQPINEDIIIDLSIQPRARAFKHINDYLVSGTLLAPMPFFLSKASRLINEKRYVLGEMIKMDGVTHNVMRISHLIDTAVFGLFYSIVVTIFLKVPIHVAEILPKSNPVLIALSLLLHQLNITGLAFITSVLSQNYHHADSVALLFYISTIIVHYLVSARAPKLFFWFMPHCPLSLFWTGVVYWERRGEGAVFSNLFTKPCATLDCIHIILVYVAFICELLMLMLLAWYINLLRPGEYGIGERWNFCCKKSFWKIKKKKVVSFHVTVESNRHVIRDVRYFEKMPKGVELAIKVAKLTKVFKGFKKKEVYALEDVTLEAKKGDITVLLGINGSGKSTLMSCVTGMCKPTIGNVYVNGLDLSTRIMEARKDLAYCPQSNCTFEYLTVKENIMFFGRIRGSNELEKDVAFIMMKLRMQLQADYYTQQLSEGMKRCLQVACALVGDADVLVLDEPTSGMDSQTRHALWDLLLMLRGSKTILISTVFMEEADAIGDRIALLHRGKLKCHGSPAFLKNAMGFNFSLTVTVKTKQQLGPLQDEIAKIVPDAKVKIDSECVATFDVPSKYKEQFPVLFDALEEKKTTLGVLTLDVGMSIEKVFMRFINQFEDQELTNEILDGFEDVRYKGFKLWNQQFWSLVERSFMFIWTHKIQFLILQVVIPVTFIWMLVLITNDHLIKKVFTSRLLQFSDDLPELEYFVAYSDLGPYLRTNILEEYRKHHPEIDITDSKDIPKDLNEMIHFRTETDKPKSNVFGFKVERNRSVFYYPWPSKSVVTKAVDLFSNFYMTLHYPQAKNKSITMIYNPLNLREGVKKTVIPAKELALIVKWAGFGSFFISLPMIPLILLPVTEYHLGVRFIHMLAGCSSFVIWFSKLTAHLVVYIIIVPTSMVMATMLVTNDRTFDHLEFMGALLLFLLAYGPTFLVYLYTCSFFLHKDHAIHQIYISTIISSVVAAKVLTINNIIVTPLWFSIPVDILIMLASFTLPSWTAALGLLHLGFVARMNSYCLNNRHLCPGNYEEHTGPMAPLNDVCCNSTEYPYSYYMNDKNHGFSALKYLVILFTQFFLYLIMLLLLQNRVLQYCFQRILSYGHKIRPHITKSKSLLDEYHFVEQQMRLLHNQRHIEERARAMGDYAILASNMHKRYGCVGRDCRIFNAVRGVSFAVKKGQCLGILGPTGAGKSTTLKMMAGYTVMTKGECNAGGYFIRRHKTHYLQNIFVTKYMGGLDRFMSGYDNLAMLSSLYGRPYRLTEKLVLHVMQFMGLESLAERAVHSYSLGCARRLAVCSALVAAAPVTLLDEPCAGGDPYTRPLVVRATRRMLRQGTACLFAEESMDWRQMQSLCDCIAIMIKGQLAALGSPVDIRTALADGYTAIIKLRVTLLYVLDETSDITETASVAKSSLKSTDEDGSTLDNIQKNIDVIELSTPEMKKKERDERVASVKQDFETMFENSILAIEHATILYYHILERPDNRIQYSELFAKLEMLKSNHQEIVEDYVLRETSINEVFSRLGRCAD